MKGVYYDAARSKPFRATITIERKTIHLGSYATPEEAEAVFLAAFAQRTEDIKLGKLHDNRSRHRLPKPVPPDTDKSLPKARRLLFKPTASLKGTPWYGL